MREGDETSCSFGLLHALAGNRQPRRVPRCHAAGKYADRLKSFPTQQLCRSDRAALLVSDGDDSPCAVGLKLIKPAVQLGQGDEHRLFNVAPLPDKFVRVAHIEDQRGCCLGELLLQLVGLQLPRPSPASDERGEQCNGSKEGQREESFLYEVWSSAHGLAARITQISIGQSARRHRNKRGDRKSLDRKPCEPQSVVEEVEGKEGNQSDKGDEAPAFSLHPFLRFPVSVLTRGARSSLLPGSER